jgi:hypothetical protein
MKIVMIIKSKPTRNHKKIESGVLVVWHRSIQTTVWDKASRFPPQRLGYVDTWLNVQQPHIRTVGFSRGKTLMVYWKGRKTVKI